MPVYDYLCPACGTRHEQLRSYEQREVPSRCACGSAAVKVPHVPRVFGDYAGFVSPGSGKWVEGRRALQEDLKRTNCVLAEPGMDRAAKLKREKDKREFETKVESYVAEAANHILG